MPLGNYLPFPQGGFHTVKLFDTARRIHTPLTGCMLFSAIGDCFTVCAVLRNIRFEYSPFPQFPHDSATGNFMQISYRATFTCMLKDI